MKRDLSDRARSGLGLRGVNPAQQARSEATFRAFIKAGQEVMAEKVFDEATIAEIARRAGASVGAFYGRFANKEIFFAALQEFMVADVEARVRECLADPALDAVGPPVLFSAIARVWIGIFRAHRGLYIACYKHSSTRPGAWTTLKRLGHKIAGMVVAKAAPALGRLGHAEPEREIRVALQFTNGLLVNAVLNDPGPISLDDPELEIYLTRFLCSFLGVERRGEIRAGAGAEHGVTL